MCTQKSLKHSSHCAYLDQGTDGGRANSNIGTKTTVITETKRRKALTKDSSIQRSSSKHNTSAVCPQVGLGFVNNQVHKDTLDFSDPDYYELDLRFHPRHRMRIHEAKDCRTFQLIIINV